MRARPAGPAESSVLLFFARSGPTKEAHRRALNRVDGLPRSVAGQVHGQNPPVPLPRGASDQRKRAETGPTGPPPPGGPIRGGIGGPIRGGVGGNPTGTHPGVRGGPRN